MDQVFGIPANILLIILLVLLAIIGLITLVMAILYPVPFRLGTRNLGRRRAQTALIIGGLALSTLIITSALGIGDTIDFSVKADVYDALGAIDETISTEASTAIPAFGFGGGGGGSPDADADNSVWFSEEIVSIAADQVGDGVFDGVAAGIEQRLPVVNQDNNLSEASVTIRGIGDISGDGFAVPTGLLALADDEILLNESLAVAIDADAGTEIAIVKGFPTLFTVASVVPDGELAGGNASVLMPLAAAQTLFEVPGQISSVYISNDGDRVTGANLTDDALDALVVNDETLLVNPVKRDQLEAAAQSAEFITTLFVTFGTFSILAGILLIFLIFSVLAAERRSELGMSRAIGLQRTDLVIQFVMEGLAYNLIAAFIGAAAGVLAAILLASVLAQLLGGGGFQVVPRVAPRSVAIGFSMGLVIAFITTAISSIRTSRINIIAAIRDLDVPSLARPPQLELAKQPFLMWAEAGRLLRKGQLGAGLSQATVGTVRAVLAFWAGLMARGPLLMLFGYLIAWAGFNTIEQGGVYGIGVALFIIGVGQLLAWFRVPARIAFSLVGVSLILYWILPVREVGALAELGDGPTDFFFSGLFMVGGAIMLFLYNADSLLNLFAGVIGRFGRLLPVARMAIAYPVMAKGRTATTLAMFSLIIFTLVSVTTISNTFSNFLDPETGSGGYDIQVDTNPFNPLSFEDFSTGIDTLVADGELDAPDAVASVAFGPVQALVDGSDSAKSYLIQGVDAEFLRTQNFKLQALSNQFETEADVWDALATRSDVILIDSFSVDRGGDPTFTADEDAFIVPGLAADQRTFDSMQVELTGLNGEVREYTIIGVLGTAPTFFGGMMNADEAAALGVSDPSRFLLRLADGVETRDAANVVEGTFSRNGAQTTLIKELIEESGAAIRGVFQLIQGFIALGLLIGIAALGVITIRAVVERRQQIGVLRAIGFQRRMVQNVFLFEGLFTAGMGAIIGYSLALTFAYNLYREVAADQGLEFLPPWPTLIMIGVLLMGASLITAWLPARSTANIAIAEALRYEA